MPKVTHTVELEASQKQLLAELSRKTRIPQNALIREAIRDFLKKQGYRDPGDAGSLASSLAPSR